MRGWADEEYFGVAGGNMRLLTAVSIGVAVTTLAGSLCAQPLPRYRPGQTIAGPQILRSWGSSEMAGLMNTWEAEFMRYQPNIRFADTLKGTETAQAALFTHVAEMALMSRPILPLERHVIFRREHHLPLEIMVATGSATREDRSFALAVLVHPDNPIARLTLAQLDGIFGDQRSGAWDEKFIWHPEAGRGADRNLRTWGQLGLTGEWADKPIHVYGYPVTIYSPTSGPMLSFRKDVMQGGDIWNPDLKEFPRGEQIAAAVAADRYGIGYTCLCHKGSGTAALKTIPLARNDGGDAVSLTSATVAARTYPLSRAVFIYIDRTPDAPIDQGLKEFLEYILSEQGQQAVTRSGDYLPLTPEAVAEQLRKIE